MVASGSRGTGRTSDKLYYPTSTRPAPTAARARSGGAPRRRPRALAEPGALEGDAKSYLRLSAAWKIDQQTAEGQALIQQSRDEGVPLLRRLPGFSRCQAASTGPRTAAQASAWESDRVSRHVLQLRV
jgi:hypothetical protein